MADRFVWHGVKKDIQQWCKECHGCHLSKINGHVRAPLTHKLPPSSRFKSPLMDGPLPQRRNVVSFCIHRPLYSAARSPIPKQTCAPALIRHWISRFDLPEDNTSDRGAQFIFSLSTELGQVIGVQLHTTTAYHPQANGMIGRLHRQLKSSLKARNTNPY